MRHVLNFGNYQQQPGFQHTGPVAEHANFHNFVMDPKPVHLKVEDYLSGDPFFDVTDEEARDGTL